jgi:hypothetical protein
MATTLVTPDQDAISARFLSLHRRNGCFSPDRSWTGPPVVDLEGMSDRVFRLRCEIRRALVLRYKPRRINRKQPADRGAMGTVQVGEGPAR